MRLGRTMSGAFRCLAQAEENLLQEDSVVTLQGVPNVWARGHRLLF
jgi:hypothetical protein